MAARWGLPVGFSDHTLGPAAAIAAVAVGAVAVEKHFTFSRLMYGSDAIHSMEPADFTALAAWLKEAAAMRAHKIDKSDVSAYLDMKRIFEKSVVTARPIRRGETLGAADLAYKKPGDGIPAARWREVAGRTAARDLEPDHKLSFEDLA